MISRDKITIETATVLCLTNTLAQITAGNSDSHKLQTIIKETRIPWDLKNGNERLLPAKYKDIIVSMQEREDKQLERWIVIDLCHVITRKMPVEDVAREMLQDGLLTRKQWETYMTKTEQREEYLLDCLQKCKPGFLEKFCSVLRKVGAHDLEKEISRHAEGTYRIYIIDILHVGHLLLLFFLL